MWFNCLQEQQIAKLKNEKLKIAMMKLKEASVQKVIFSHCLISFIHCTIISGFEINIPVCCLQMVLKAHNIDGSTKMVAIHEGMNVRDVCILLAERNHQELGPNWTLVERLSDLHLGKQLVSIMCSTFLTCVHVYTRTNLNCIVIL